MKTYVVRFGWWMPVMAEYEATLSDHATPEEIIRAAHTLAEQDGWERQDDCGNGITPTFVDEIQIKGERRRISIPDKWDENRMLYRHFFTDAISDALRAAETALAEAHQNCGGGDDNIFAEPLKKVRAVLAYVPDSEWFEFTAYNQQTVYGFGSSAEASEYCDHLNKGRENNLYSHRPVRESLLLAELEAGRRDQINLDDELAAIAGIGKHWQDDADTVELQ